MLSLSLDVVPAHLLFIFNRFLAFPPIL